MANRLPLACCLLLILAVAGCGFKKYPNTLEKNLTVRTTTSGSLFSSVDAFLHVYEPPQPDCKKKYLGGMKLKNGETEVGLPSGQPVYVDFVFHADSLTTNAFLHNGGIITLRPGMRYVALVRYVDRVYGVSIREVGSTGLPGREVPYRKPECSAL